MLSEQGSLDQRIIFRRLNIEGLISAVDRDDELSARWTPEGLTLFDVHCRQSKGLLLLLASYY